MRRFCGMLLFLVVGAAGGWSLFLLLSPAPLNGQDDKDKKEPRRPALAKDKATDKPLDNKDAPDEEKIFVWPAPEEGDQTLFVLRAVGPDMVEAAYLVPFSLQIQTGKKYTTEELNKKIGGRLIHVRLKGRNGGGVKGDAWLGKDEGGWLSGVK